MKNSLGFRNLSDSDVTSYSSAASLSGKILVNRRSGNKWHKIFTLISLTMFAKLAPLGIKLPKCIKSEVTGPLNYQGFLLYFKRINAQLANGPRSIYSEQVLF